MNRESYVLFHGTLKISVILYNQCYPLRPVYVSIIPSSTMCIARNISFVVLLGINPLVAYNLSRCVWNIYAINKTSSIKTDILALGSHQRTIITLQQQFVSHKISLSTLHNSFFYEYCDLRDFSSRSINLQDVEETFTC